MIHGSFCYRREAEQIWRWLYRSFRAIKTAFKGKIKAFNDVYDLFAGTGCLAELIARSLVVRGSAGALVHVVLIDRKPRPHLRLELGSWLRLMPDIGRKLLIKFESKDPALKPLADALTKYFQLIHDHNIWAYRTYRAKSPTFDTIVLRALQAAGKLRIHIMLAEEWLRDAARSNAKNIFKTGSIFVVDPPRRNTHRYYGKKAHQLTDIDYVLKLLADHEALTLYVDYIEAVQEAINKYDFSVFSYYVLYSSGSASRHRNYRVVMAFLITKKLIKNSTNIDISKKWHIPDIDELKDPLTVSHLNEPRLAELDYPPRDFRYKKKKQGLLR